MQPYSTIGLALRLKDFVDPHHVRWHLFLIMACGKGKDMKEILLALLVGACAGIVDIIPMIKQKLNKFFIMSAFVQWVVLGVIISNASLFGLVGWANGLIIAVVLALPISILVLENDKKSVPIILIMSAILGSLVGLISFRLGL